MARNQIGEGLDTSLQGLDLRPGSDVGEETQDGFENFSQVSIKDLEVKFRSCG